MTTTGVQKLTRLDGISERNDEMLCPCKEFRKTDLQHILAGQPNITFDVLLQQTGAGGTCTACLLDLEYYFTTMPRGRPSIAARATRQPRKTVSLKQQFYHLLDGLSPQTPMSLTDYMPVLYGHGIKEWVCIANHSLFYENGICASDFNLTLTVRNAKGRKVHDESCLVAAGTARRIPVSDFFVPLTDSLGVGSVCISRQFLTPGIRGTTRPQVEIVSADGACAVHSQAPGRLRDRWLSVYHRPDDERLFVTAINASSMKLGVEITYPFAADGTEPSLHRLSIPANGAMLHEIILPEPVSRIMKGSLFSIRIRTNGMSKVHVLCATPTLRRFSIDHL